MSTIEAPHDSEPAGARGSVATGNATGASRWLTRGRALDVVSFIARFYMAYIWISAGVAKLDSHMETTQTIMAYEIFTPEWSDLLARMIGPLEIAGGVLLLLGVFLRHANVVAIVVLSLFIVGIAQAWSRGLIIDCGCFGVEQLSADPRGEYAITIARDVVFIALSAWSIYRPFKKWAIYP